MRIEPNSQEHRYAAPLEWTGQVGPGPMEYATYGRSFRVRVQGKPELIGSADPVFRGDASKFNPEDLLVISVAGCHMLTYPRLMGPPRCHGPRLRGQSDRNAGGAYRRWREARRDHAAPRRDDLRGLG